MGSAAGGVLGAAYLTAARPMHAAQPVVAAAAAAATASEPNASAAAGPTAPAAVSAPAAARAVSIPPFRFAAVAQGSNDLQCLAEAVYFESRGEPKQGQQAVAQVILNRVRHPAFPKTICAVVHQKSDAGCQFSFACSPEPRGRDETAWIRAEAVARGALHGAVMREVGDATHFESVRVAAFAGLLKVAQIGEHVFYRFGGHDGGAGMFRQTPAPSATPAAAKVLLASLSTPTRPALPLVPAEKAMAPAPKLALVGVASVGSTAATPVAAAPVRAVAPGPAGAGGATMPVAASATLTSTPAQTVAPGSVTVAS